MQGIVKGGLNDSRSVIKSMQRDTVTLTAASTNISISAVDLTKAVLIMNIINTSGVGSIQNLIVQGKLTSTTNINFKINTFTENIIVNYVVVEFDNVKSLQSGTIIENSKPKNVTISAVNVNKSLIFYSFSSANGNIAVSYAMIGTKFVDSTTIQFEGLSYQNAEITYYVVEFY